MIVLVILLAFACKKDEDDKDYNMLKITTGEHAGFAYTFYPNMGFWSNVKSSVKYVHLVFGATDNMVVSGKDIMSIQFYDEGSGNVSFPSAQGQHANFGVTIAGAEKYYTAEDATLSISEFTDERLKGTLSGEFISNGPEFEIVNVTMDIDIAMTQL